MTKGDELKVTAQGLFGKNTVNPTFFSRWRGSLSCKIWMSSTQVEQPVPRAWDLTSVREWLVG